MIKNIIYILVLLFVSNQAISQAKKFGEGVNHISRTCKKEINKVFTFYREQKTKESQYYKCYMYGEEKGIETEKLLTEIWYNGKNYKYQNPFMTLYQDKQTRVVVLHDSKILMLSDSKAVDMQGQLNLSFEQQIDSLMKLSTSASCIEEQKGVKRLVIKLPPVINEKNNPVKELTYYYKKGTGEILKTVYEYYSSEGSNKQIIEYLEVNTSFDKNVIKTSAKNFALQKNKPKSIYRDFEFIDQRLKK